MASSSASASIPPEKPSKSKKEPSFCDDLYPTSKYGPCGTASIMAKVMRQAAAGVCFVQGFDRANQSVLETVAHLMTSYLLAVCNSTKDHCEQAGRTIPTLGDVWVALVSMGFNVEELPEYVDSISKGGNLVIPPPKSGAKEDKGGTLRIGKARPHPAFVDDFFPPFPDPHTYIRTEISGEPDTSYEKVRELHAQRKRDTESLLVDYMLRIHPKTCLFREYETKVKEEARRALHDRERQKEALRAARKQAKAQEKLRQEVKVEDPSEMPECLMEEDILEDKEESNQANSFSDEEMDYDMPETETSLVLKRIPAYCNVLDPSLESRPYLSALVSEETLDDENTESKVNTAQNNQSNREGDEQVYDNAFLRPPRMPAKGNFVQF